MDALGTYPANLITNPLKRSLDVAGFDIENVDEFHAADINATSINTTSINFDNATIGSSIAADDGIFSNLTVNTSAEFNADVDMKNNAIINCPSISGGGLTNPMDEDLDMGGNDITSCPNMLTNPMDANIDMNFNDIVNCPNVITNPMSAALDLDGNAINNCATGNIDSLITTTGTFSGITSTALTSDFINTDTITSSVATNAATLNVAGVSEFNADVDMKTNAIVNCSNMLTNPAATALEMGGFNVENIGTIFSNHVSTDTVRIINHADIKKVANVTNSLDADHMRLQVNDLNCLVLTNNTGTVIDLSPVWKDKWGGDSNGSQNTFYLENVFSNKIQGSGSSTNNDNVHLTRMYVPLKGHIWKIDWFRENLQNRLDDTHFNIVNYDPGNEAVLHSFVVPNTTDLFGTIDVHFSMDADQLYGIRFDNSQGDTKINTIILKLYFRACL